MKIIGLTGKAGAGKTTFANMVIDKYLELTKNRIGCSILPFAKALKDLALSLGWDGIKDEKGRKLLQLLGTDVCRNCIDNEYWIKRWLESLAKQRSNNIHLVVVDDVRFPNEVVTINNLNGDIYKVVGRQYDDVPNHESEQDLDIIRTINNNSTFQELQLKATMLVKDLIQWTY